MLLVIWCITIYDELITCDESVTNIWRTLWVTFDKLIEEQRI
ncbi:hypothetical protein J2T19_003433 [Paenibacillus tundrae]|uniref:Uncharacterized protein n=1 Tax=Paenibacillus tundrae TaxID=528187 RepID=A0ABT9WFD9_9BACL|nr:hypothetical protein [Paenibacillus tundrae]